MGNLETVTLTKAQVLTLFAEPAPYDTIDGAGAWNIDGGCAGIIRDYPTDLHMEGDGTLRVQTSELSYDVDGEVVGYRTTTVWVRKDGAWAAEQEAGC